MRKLFFLILLPILTYAQDNPLTAFDNLVDKTWEAEGKWGNDSPFKQEAHFEYSLDSAIVTVQSWGFVDTAQTQFGLRNHGIRRYDKESETIQFWEFDVFGGLTQGTVLIEDKNLLYQYQYGDTFVTDAWEYVNDSTYNFKVGIYEDGEWKQQFLSTQFLRKE